MPATLIETLPVENLTPVDDIAPSTAKRPRHASKLVTVAAVLLVFAALEIWRPYFFLTDDNMSAVLPAFADLGHTLREGKIPRTTSDLYAGSYDLWRDPGNLTLLFPTHLAALLLATTRFRFAAIEMIALGHLLVGALAMQACVRAFCRRFNRPLAEWMTCFLGVSYVTSSYSLAIGSSWFNFMGNQAAMPIVALGLVETRRKTGFALVAGGMLYNLLGGHLAPFLFSGLFLGLLALSLGVIRRSWEPVLRYSLGTLLALLLLSPVLLQFVSGFLGSSRNTPPGVLPVINNLPFPALFLGGTVGVESIGPWDFAPDLGFLAEIALPLSFSAAAICFLFVLGTTWKFRGPERAMFGLLVLVAIFVGRPQWLQSLLAHIPFFRSLRWPMREAVLFIFFAHLLVALGWHRLPGMLRFALPAISALAYALPLFLLPSPTFNRFPVDRSLLLSARADQLWADVQKGLHASADFMVVPLLNRALYQEERRTFINRAPHTLLGAYNYPVLFGMKSSTGYTMPGFAQKFRGNSPVLWPGYFLPEQFSEADVADPHLLFTYLVSNNPITIEYRLNGARVRASFPEGIEKAAVLATIR